MATLLVTGVVSSGLEPLSDRDMSGVTGQAGLSVDADLITAPFATTLINAAKEGEDKFIAISDIELNMSFTNMLLDADGSYANGNPAVVMTLPDRIEFGDAANPTNIGSLKVSWTEDGSNPTGSVAVPAEYLVRQGVVNNPGDGLSLFDEIFSTYTEVPMGYRFTHDNLANVEVTSTSRGSYNSGTGVWSFGPVDYNVGNYEFASMVVEGQRTVNFIVESNTNNVDCDNGDNGAQCSNYPDGYLQIISKQTLAEVYYLDNENSPNAGRVERETGSTLLGNPIAPQANREIGGITLQGGFDLGGRVVIVPQ